MDAPGTSNPPKDDEWVYNIPVPDARPFGPDTLVPKEWLDGIEDLPAYSILNGRPEDITPYLLRGTIVSACHWVPLNGVAPKDSLKCVDGFIKSALLQLTITGGYNRNTALNRTAAIILGAARAVMTANYELRFYDLIPAETAAPVLNAKVGTDGKVVYNSLLPAAHPHGDILTKPLELTPAEKVILKVVMRSAQAIVPIQGLNLINEGHHYLSERNRSSYRAFHAVERQVWTPTEWRDMQAANDEAIRDLMWHKAGHPIAVHLKELAATSLKVKENLENAKLGSAVARLPALEADVRAAQTYLKVSEAVTPIWETFGGHMKPDRIRTLLACLERLPKGGKGFEKGVEVAEGYEVRTRAETLDMLRRVVKANADKVALAYGFYCAMVERGGAEMGGAAADTLRRAFSLRKLVGECAASFAMGGELFRDYQSLKARQRNEGAIVFPRYELDL